MATTSLSTKYFLLLWDNLRFDQSFFCYPFVGFHSKIICKPLPGTSPLEAHSAFLRWDNEKQTQDFTNITRLTAMHDFVFTSAANFENLFCEVFLNFWQGKDSTTSDQAAAVNNSGFHKHYYAHWVSRAEKRGISKLQCPVQLLLTAKFFDRLVP